MYKYKKDLHGVQVFMNLVTTALIALDLSWVQRQIRQNESTGYSSLTRALVLASQAGRMTRLLRVMHLVGAFRVGSSCALLTSATAKLQTSITCKARSEQFKAGVQRSS